jgi:predicted small lipoprotein YifL
MVRLGSGVCFVNRFAARPLSTLATMGALALSLLLAACGLKGGLEPPPSAEPPKTRIDGQSAPPPQDGETQPQPTRKRIFLDWLLD